MYNGLTVKWNAARSFGQADSVEPRATKLFERALRPANPNRVQRLLGHTMMPLRNLAEAVEHARVTHRFVRGARTVALDQIIGSVGKSSDFDAAFHPLQRHSEGRWLKVATAMLRGVELPPIELIQVRDAYFVKDGHHRISVARTLGYRDLDAIVTVWGVESEQVAVVA
jgi:hypothetical protein